MFVAVAYVGAGIAAILVLVAAIDRDAEMPAVGAEAVIDPLPEIRAEMEDRSTLALAWKQTLTDVCENLDLQAEGLAPSCRTGALTIGDGLFEDPTSPQLTEDGMRKLQFAVPILLETLRRNEVVWRNIESIELRGHSDPRARRDPYVTNLVSSRQRPLGVMIYLSSEWALSGRDREDLQRLAIVSAASSSRPPTTCPEANGSCYPFWRRVEIIPRLRGERVPDDMQHLIERVDALAPATTPGA